MFLRYRVDIRNQKSYMLDNQKKRKKLRKKLNTYFQGVSSFDEILQLI